MWCSVHATRSCVQESRARVKSQKHIITPLVIQDKRRWPDLFKSLKDAGKKLKKKLKDKAEELKKKVKDKIKRMKEAMKPDNILKDLAKQSFGCSVEVNVRDGIFVCNVCRTCPPRATCVLRGFHFAYARGHSGRATSRH